MIWPLGGSQTDWSDFRQVPWTFDPDTCELTFSGFEPMPMGSAESAQEFLIEHNCRASSNAARATFNLNLIYCGVIVLICFVVLMGPHYVGWID